MYIKSKVENLTNKFKTRDPFDLSDRLNIIVVKRLFNAEINGLYQYEKRCKFIFINQALSDDMQKVVCAHELGHAILHPKLNCTYLKENTFMNINKLEREANRFAAELLISDEILKNCPGYVTYDEIAADAHIPIELVELKCNKYFFNH